MEEESRTEGNEDNEGVGWNCAATEGVRGQRIMKSTPLGNYATMSRNFGEYSPTVLDAKKSQTLSGQFGNEYYPLIRESLTPQFKRLPPAGRSALRKVGTVSPLFRVLRFPAILSTAPIEFSQSKIQTPSGKFRRSRLRNIGRVATPGGAQ